MASDGTWAIGLSNCNLIYCFPDGMDCFTLTAFKIFFYAWLLEVYNVFRRGSLFMFWLSFFDQWVSFSYPVWEVFSHYFTNIFPYLSLWHSNYSYVAPVAIVSQLLRLFIFLWSLFSVFFKLHNFYYCQWMDSLFCLIYFFFTVFIFILKLFIAV